MGKLCGWILLLIVMHYIYTNEIYDFWSNFAYGAAASGILPVAWFLFTYCFLIILGYPLNLLLRKYSKIFVGITFLWGVAIALNYGRNWLMTKPQTLWFHLYIGYFMMGVTLAWMKRHLLQRSESTQLLISATIFLLCSCIYAFKIMTASTFQLPHTYYGTWFYTLWLLSLFWLCSLMKVNNRFIQTGIKQMASGTFVVYLGHLPILLYLTQRYPLQNVSIAIVFVIIFFFGFEVLAIGLKRMPLLRKLV